MTTRIAAAPQRKVDVYDTIDIVTFVISILLLGTNYDETNNSFFTTVFILFFSPCLRKLGSLISRNIRLWNKKPYKATNIIEMILMGVISIICALGILGMMNICKINEGTTSIIKICVVEKYVFFAGKGFDLRICIVALFIVMALKLFNTISEGVVVE